MRKEDFGAETVGAAGNNFTSCEWSVMVLGHDLLASSDGQWPPSGGSRISTHRDKYEIEGTNVAMAALWSANESSAERDPTA